MNGVAHDHVGEAPHVVPPVFDPAFKRLFDLVLAGLGLMLTLPIWMIVVVWIWLDDRCPVFFRQERIGRFGKPVRVLKFRSMIRDHGSIELQASPDDPRITRVGRVRGGDGEGIFHPRRAGVRAASIGPPRPDRYRSALRAKGDPASPEVPIRPDLRQESPEEDLDSPPAMAPPVTGEGRRWAALALLRNDIQLLWLDMRLVLRSIWIALGGKWAV